MYNEKIEALIKAALADGVLTEKEKQILFKRAEAECVDLDEFEMILDARLVELQKEQKSSAPKSDKFGEIKKCPACGAIVGAFKGACPECGFEFTGVDANLSSRRLYEALSKTESVNKKAEIIETFPIPNTKADLLEFLTSLKPRITDPSNEFATVYLKKYTECIEKAKVSFSNDKDLHPFINGFDRLISQIQNKKTKTEIASGIKTVVGLLLLIVCICSPIAIPFINRKVQEKKIEKVSVLIEQKNAEEAKTLLASIKFKKKTVYKFYDAAEALVKLYISNGEIEKAVDVHLNFRPRKPEHLSTLKRYKGYGENELFDLIRNAYIKSGDYDKAWNYDYSTRYNVIGEANEYFTFMSDVVNYLCQNNRKKEAREFVRDYCVWFEQNVDPERNSDTKWMRDDYKILLMSDKSLYWGGKN